MRLVGGCLVSWQRLARSRCSIGCACARSVKLLQIHCDDAVVPHASVSETVSLLLRPSDAARTRVRRQPIRIADAFQALVTSVLTLSATTSHSSSPT
jgi:hypothetical protein